MCCIVNGVSFLHTEGTRYFLEDVLPRPNYLRRRRSDAQLSNLLILEGSFKARAPETMLIELLRRLKYGDVDARRTSREYFSLSHLNERKNFLSLSLKKKKIFEKKLLEASPSVERPSFFSKLRTLHSRAENFRSKWQTNSRISHVEKTRKLKESENCCWEMVELEYRVRTGKKNTSNNLDNCLRENPSEKIIE